MMENLERCCIHTITTKPLAVEDAIETFARRGIQGITVWRDALENRNIKDVSLRIREAGLETVSLCRGGFFPHADAGERKKAIEDNLEAIDEAEALGAPLVVLVCGADPNQSLEDSRNQIVEGIHGINDRAKDAGVKLAIEPLHPMYADTRSAISTMAQANEVAESMNDNNVGIAVDVYHLWWDPDLEKEIDRCGSHGRLFAFHVCDWRSPTEDLLLDRGLMGEGCINIPQIRTWVEKTGYGGFIEVEIFSNVHWAEDQSVFLDKITDAYLKYV